MAKSRFSSLAPGARVAVVTMVVVFAATIAFHLLVLFGVVPFNIVWGGRLKDEKEMVVFELISLAINGAMLALVLAYAMVWAVKIPLGVYRWFFGAICALFILNTAGNLLSVNQIEKAIFTPVTALLAFSAGRISFFSRELR